MGTQRKKTIHSTNKWKKCKQNTPRRSSQLLIQRFLNIHNSVYDATELLSGPMRLDVSLFAAVVDLPIRAIIALDTIYLVTSDGTAKSFMELVSVVRTAMFNYFQDGLPLRGAITFGSCMEIGDPHKTELGIIFGPIIIGKAFLDAHVLEKKQEWSGCIVDESAISQYNSFQNETASSLEECGIIQYDVPCKDNAKKHYVLNWFLQAKSFFEMTKEEVCLKFAGRGKSLENEGAKRKLENTITFFESVAT